MKFKPKKLYSNNYTRIIYGKPNYNVHLFGFGTIYNRLVRANIITKGLLLLNENIYGAYKDLWEDMWWNDLIDRVSFSNLIINKLGYIPFYDSNTAIKVSTANKMAKNNLIREFIYFWFFDYLLLPKEDDKKKTINTLRYYSKPNSTFYEIPLSLKFLSSKCNHLEKLLTLLIKDDYVRENDKEFIKQLYRTITIKYKPKNKKTKKTKKNKKTKKFIL